MNNKFHKDCLCSNLLKSEKNAFLKNRIDKKRGSEYLFDYIINFQKRNEKSNCAKFTRNDLRYYGLKNDIPFFGPEIVQLKITSKCNMNCSYCYYHSHFIKKKNEKLSTIKLSIIKRIIDDCDDIGTDIITLYGDGEPFTHPQILKIIDYIHQKGMDIWVFTNASLIHTIPLEYLKMIKVFIINVSFFHFETFKKIYRGREKYFKLMKNNVNRISALKVTNEGRPYIISKFVLMEDNYSDLLDYIGWAEQIGLDEIYIEPMRQIKDTEKILLSKSSLGKLKIVLRKIENGKYKIKNNINILKDILSVPGLVYDHNNYYSKFLDNGIKCYHGWFFLSIDLEGGVFPCCCSHGHTVAGNVHEKSLKEIWLSDQLQKRRIEGKYFFRQKNPKWKKCGGCPRLRLDMDIHNKLWAVNR